MIDMPIQHMQTYTAEGDPFLELCKMYDAATPEEAMMKGVNVLIKKSGQEGFPIKFEKLLNACNARLIKTKLPTPGRLEIEDRGYAIYVDESDSENRQRFSVAHEIGHIIITDAIFQKAGLLRTLRYPSYWSVAETLCNKAASEILIPKLHFIEKIKEVGLTSEGIDEICRFYGVSRDSFFVKFTNIFKPSAIILCKSQSTRSKEILPSVYKIWSNNLSSLPIKEGPIPANNIMLNLIKATVRNGQVWNSTLIGKINGKNSKILRISMLTPNSIHYKKSKLSTLSESEYLDKDFRNYDIMLFYLPIDIMSNWNELIHAIKT